MTQPGQQTLPTTAATFSPATSDTPSWLLTPATGVGPSLPVHTLNQTLPLHELTWEDFERLCLRLLRLEARAVRAALYGVPGQAQQGIDAYAIGPTTPDEATSSRPHVVLQSRRIKDVTPTNLESSVDDFLSGTWAEISQKFIYATSAPARSTQVIDKIEGLAKRLEQRSIALEVWDQESISEKLKGHPELVDDFLGRPWVKAFCGDDDANRLGKRLDVQDMAELRRELARVYANTFGLADPGFVAFGLNEFRQIQIMERFVTPDLVPAVLQTASYPYTVAADSEEVGSAPAQETHSGEYDEWNAWLLDEHSWSTPTGFAKASNAQPAPAVERRRADQWIGLEQLQIIIGDPGAGKSTLLRYLVLDLLGEKPRWAAVAERWGTYLPVWLPFHFLATMVVGQTGQSASVGLALKAWLEQNESGQIWPLIEKALEDRRLLLVVDGLDEWTDDDAGDYAARAVERFAAIRGIPVVASTRPYGLTKLTLAAGWVYSRIAPLTFNQQKSLVTHYFRAAAESESQTSLEELVSRRADDFLAQVHHVPELNAFSGTPLFLILLVMLRLANSSPLPDQRFAVYDDAVRLLLAVLPSKRRTAADITRPRSGLPDPDLRMVLRKVSYVNQLRGNVSTLDEGALREDFVEALRDPEHLSMTRQNAVQAANQLLDVAEGELGLLVRTGPQQLAFIHRVMQEQLAAEYVTSRLEFDAVKKLFEEYVGDPGWREVLLIAFRRISRPSEVSGLLTTIQGRIGDTPTGLRAREFLAEVTFGPYSLSAGVVQRNAAEIIDVIETHPYGPHKARLLDAVLTGVTGSSTGSIVRECLERWTLMIREPSPDLVAQIALIPPDTSSLQMVRLLLVRALRNSNRYAAFDNACTIVRRCSRIGTDEERQYFRTELMNILADPPSGVVQAAALTALALGWRDDVAVSEILDEARSHSDEHVPLVGIADALNVLVDVFPDVSRGSHPGAQELTENERGWLIERLFIPGITDVHFGMLVAAISAAVRNDQSVLADLLESQRYEGDYASSEVRRAVMLAAFGDDEKVVDLVCDQISAEGLRGLSLPIMAGSDLLASTYHGGSLHNGRVAEAIEQCLDGADVLARDRELFSLAAIDQGPMMKNTLLEALAKSSMPHWAAAALAAHFGDDPEVQAELRSVILGEPVRAAIVAQVAPRVLSPVEVIPRLMDVLRALAASSTSNSMRYDIVASALIQAHRDLVLSGQPGLEEDLREAIDLIPQSLHWMYGHPRTALAAEIYPAENSIGVLDPIRERDDRPLELFLQVFRNDPGKLKPYLAEASNVLRSLPSYLRAHVCRMLFERGVEPGLVAELTKRWADERAEPNKSVASFAYHQALLKSENNGVDNDPAWDPVLEHLGEQASIVGPDFEARRRAAWVGMCVLTDWSPVVERTETTDDSTLVTVSLHDYLNGPDRVLLQQISTAWERLRSTFGEEVITRLSGRFRESGQDAAWNWLALVASENPTLERELERELTTNVHIRSSSGILLWVARRRNESSDAFLEHLRPYLRSNDYLIDEPVVNLLAEPERIGLTLEQLQGELEQALDKDLLRPAMELLAMLAPNHPMVADAWRQYSEGRNVDGTAHSVNAGTHFALAYAVASSDEIVAKIQEHHERLSKLGNPFLDRVFARHSSYRLRRDLAAASKVREAILDSETPDYLVAVLAPLLRNAVGLDDELLAQIELRIFQQDGRRLATVVRDHHAGSSLPVRAILVGVAEGAHDDLTT